ncbi:MAG: ribonuclease HII [Bacteroidetes bacterium]|nr:ribonuclease HII [Bacteroidota bacterium]MCL2302199.1 ribonuclease HII [Lentimicrobiaceae bacterium]MCL2302279.1 ribonuclease HII [Lentimicrobiaceae bacterium]
MALKSQFSEYALIEAGCDEAGRGCLAGPLFAAAVIFPFNYVNEQLNDSKQLNKAQRETLRKIIMKDAVAYSIASVSEAVIDEINILNASFRGMNLAVKGLKVQPELLLIDGNRFKNETAIPYQCIIKGDAKYLAIAAASILAKTFRDDFMEDLDAEFSMYGWKQNKGYPTKAHQEALLKFGKTPYHRKSFQMKSQLKIEF